MHGLVIVVDTLSSHFLLHFVSKAWLRWTPCTLHVSQEICRCIMYHFTRNIAVRAKVGRLIPPIDGIQLLWLNKVYWIAAHYLVTIQIVTGCVPQSKPNSAKFNKQRRDVVQHLVIYLYSRFAWYCKRWASFEMGGFISTVPMPNTAGKYATTLSPLMINLSQASFLTLRIQRWSR